MKLCTVAGAAVLAVAHTSPWDLRASCTEYAPEPFVQERTLEEITKALSKPGVYLDSGAGSAGLSFMVGSMPAGLDFKDRSGPEPVRMKIPGPRADVRTGSQPTFYVYKVEGARTGKPGAYTFASDVRTANVDKDYRLVEFATFRKEGPNRRVEAAPVEIELAAQQLGEDLFRMRPVKALQPGEYIILPARAAVEGRIQIAMNMRYAPTTTVYAFGVDSQ